MNIAFAGFKHPHIYSLYNLSKETYGINICGCYEENAESRERAYNIVKAEFVYADYNALLNDDEVEIVAIGDYYGKRGDMIIKALMAGKHIIADKPICTSLSELKKIEKLSKKYNLKISCMLDLRYMPSALTAKELIESEKLGELKIVSFTGQHCLDYYNRPKWYFEKGKHGGTINDIGIHGIDLITFLTGMDYTKTLYSRTWNCFAYKDFDFKDCAQFSYLLNNNITVLADVSYSAPKFEKVLPTYWNFCFWFSQALMIFNYEEKTVKVYYNNNADVKIYQGKISKSNYLIDLIKEIKEDNAVITNGVLKSAKYSLKIQNKANSLL